MAEGKNYLYLVSEITEEDFGCEGRREEDGDKVSVRLTNGLGASLVLQQSDQYLYNNQIDEGDVVELNITGNTPDDIKLIKKFHIRKIEAKDADAAVAIEQTCFPPNEACSEKMMRERVEKAADSFMIAEVSGNVLAVDHLTVVGFINGIATNDEKFRDDFFTDASLHNPAGKNVMLCGVDVLPAYRNQGLASLMMQAYKADAKKQGRENLLLTNLEEKVPFYKRMGYVDLGQADSTWGGEVWHEMKLVLK